MKNWVLFLMMMVVLGINSLKAQNSVGFLDDWWRADGTVSAIVQEGNTIYLGGNYKSLSLPICNGTPINRVTGFHSLNYEHPNLLVDACVSDGVGGWYICGAFTKVGSTIRKYIARINADGKVSSWNPSINDRVTALYVSGNTVYVAGYFYQVNGQSRYHLAAIDATTGAVTSWNPNIDGDVSIITGKNGIIYIGGSFSNVGLQARENIAAIDSITGQATPWNPSPSCTNCLGYVQVSSICLNSNRIFVGGNFTSIGGQNRNHIAEIDLTTGAATSWNPNANGTVNCIAFKGNSVYVGGGLDFTYPFTIIGGQNRNKLAEINATTGNVTSWNPNINGGIYSLISTGNTIYVAGDFSNIGGQTRYDIAEIDSATGIATPWNPKRIDLGLISAISVHGNEIYVGGSFNVWDTVNRNNLAALDATNGAPLPWNPDANKSVLTLVTDGNYVYAGGKFDSVGGQIRSKIAAIEASTGNLVPYSLVVNGDVNTVTTLGNKLYFGGAFTSVNGQTRNHLASINTTTGNLSSWDPNANNVVNALATRGNRVYVGGKFSTMSGQNRKLLAAFNANNGTLTTWAPPVLGTSINAFSINGNTIYVGGNFDINGKLDKNLAAIDTNGIISTWNANVSTEVNCVAAKNGVVYMGGSYVHNLECYDSISGSTTLWNPYVSEDYIGSIAVNGNIVYVGGNYESMKLNLSRYNFVPVIDSIQIKKPTISSFTPANGCNGTTINIIGTNFTNITSVKIGGSPVLSYIVDSATSISATLGGNTTGNIVVESMYGSAYSLGIFTVNTITATISLNSSTLICSGTYSSYKWYRNGVAIPGATNASYNATQSGGYYVEVTDSNNCSGQSNTISYTLDVNDITQNGISLSPIPTKNLITINGINQPTVAVYNLMGQKVLAPEISNEISLASLPNGNYIVHVFNKDMELMSKVKVVKE